VVFLSLVLALSSGFYAFAWLADDAPRRWLSYSAAFMWCPGLAALLTRLLLRRSLRGLGFGPGALRHYGVAYLVPLAVCLPVYLLAWLTGIGGFNPTPIEEGRLRLGLPGGTLGTAALAFLGLGLAPLLGVAATLGEELGWRGLLVPRLLVLTDPIRTSLITGVVWSLWHYPVHFAVLPFYLPRLPLWYATACFTLSVVVISGVYTWLRLRSGSVWPAALLHAASNTYMGAFEALTTHTGVTSYWTYEYGAGFALVLPLVALPFWRSLRPPTLTPPGAPAGAAGS
jgi:membrane protease YdiL (CAAX protease family)